MKKNLEPGPLRIKLAPEWLGQSGLWRLEDGEGYVPVDADELGLSEDLADRLEDWTDEFDSIFDDDNPAASRFSTREAHAAFMAEGEAIAALIRREMGAEVLVVLPGGLAPENA